jgi:cell division protein FtsW (lipid II flippase)
MAVTIVSAADRTAREQRVRAAEPGAADAVLFAASFVVALAILLTVAGRFVERDDAQLASGAPIDVNKVDRVDLIERALVPAFPDETDRQFAARTWLHALTAARSNRAFTSVGAAAAVSVPINAVDGTPHLDVFSRRVAAMRAATADTRPALTALPLFTSAELAAIKKAFVVRTRSQFRREVLLWAALYVAAFHVVSSLWRLRRVDGDRLLLAAVHLISGIGFVILLSRPDPLRDTLLFVRYTQGVLVGLGLTLLFSLVDVERGPAAELSYLPLAGAIGLCALLIAFGSGPGHSGAKVNLGSVQPIEAIRLLLAFFLAGYFARRWELLRGLRSRAIRGVGVPSWINLPRGEYVLPVAGGVAVALGLFAIQRDLGPALLLSLVFLAMYAVARGRLAMPLVGFAVLMAGFYAGNLLHLSKTLSDRVAMWQSPWDNRVPGGDQIAHALWALASGGSIGTGLGLGDSRYLPAGHTDLVLAAVGEELGLVGLMVLAAAYAFVAWRGFRIARSASTDYGFFLAAGLTLFLIVPALVMGAGVVGAIPLTGLVTPFLSYGGSAMAANFTALGVLSSIRAGGRPPADLAAFAVPLRWAHRALAASALALAAIVVDIQVVRADDYLVRPQLGVQADGGRRYAYNPRVLDAARQFPRGSVFDRRGLPLATDDAAVVARAQPAYQKLGVALEQACPSPTERCYPLGGRAFHLLGDARSRVNWSAPNSSYIERDGEAVLRGYDDHAAVVATTDAAGRPMSTIKRDYRQIIPLVRHRFERDHPTIVAMRRKPRDVRLTIDAPLQVRVAAIVEARAREASGRAAAVVLDPDTGSVLASVSYPWPSADEPADESEHDLDPLLDRARYGLYPPGSTFKLVTAAAALRRDAALASTTFSCTRLPDGRVGAKLPGWTRPVRDDVLDARPHGTLDMHAAVVHSCNAYFAQLAVKLGPQALLDCAQRLGIALTPSSAAVGRVRDTLPQVGYGQADVRTTPLRMARVAAAIAANGTVRDARWDQSAPIGAAAFLSPAAARILAGYMRDAVTMGTGSSLRSHPFRIAGKTGTAEVTGAASHAWFVGYAPYGAAKKRIAFAIVVEHGGYGGRSAAPIAGEIVSAAALSGLVEP